MSCMPIVVYCAYRKWLASKLEEPITLWWLIAGMVRSICIDSYIKRHVYYTAHVLKCTWASRKNLEHWIAQCQTICAKYYCQRLTLMMKRLYGMYIRTCISYGYRTIVDSHHKFLVKYIDVRAIIEWALPQMVICDLDVFIDWSISLL